MDSDRQWTEFNINDYVMVKLTQHGRDEWVRRWREMGVPDKYIQLPAEDAEGWSKWQAHSLMSELGHACFMGGKLPFLPTIRVAVASKE